jgi:hypothetical protein
MNSRCLAAAGFRFSGRLVPAGELGRPCGWLTGRSSPPRPHRGCHVPLCGDATGEDEPFTPEPWRPRHELLGAHGLRRWVLVPTSHVAQQDRLSHHVRSVCVTRPQQVHPSSLPVARLVLVTGPPLGFAAQASHEVVTVLARWGGDGLIDARSDAIRHRITPSERLRVAHRRRSNHPRGAAALHRMQSRCTGSGRRLPPWFPCAAPHMPDTSTSMLTPSLTPGTGC